MTKETSATLKHGGWGFLIGVVTAIVIGFGFGGWVTAGTVKKENASAVLANKAEICVAQFKMVADYEAQLKKFTDTNSWERRDFIEKGGWDKMPGEDTARGYVSSSCTEEIEKQISN